MLPLQTKNIEKNENQRLGFIQAVFDFQSNQNELISVVPKEI